MYGTIGIQKIRQEKEKFVDLAQKKLGEMAYFYIKYWQSSALAV